MADSPILDRIEKELEEIRSSGLWRQTASPSGAPIDLSTNSYLALHSNPEVGRAARELAGEVLSGNLASRLVGSQSPLYERLEEEISLWKGAEAALVFTSGYAANVGVLSSLCGRDTDIFGDRLNHASILDGARLSGGRLVRYRHGDMGDLEERLEASGAREKVVVTETVFSMDGDLAPLADACELADRHACLLVVDEAHAAGVFGRRRASGCAEEAGCEDRIDVRIGTLSKAAAGAGGFFAGSRRLRDYLVNCARSLIYSTGLPPSVLAWDVAAVSHIRTHPGAGRALLDRSAGFRERLRGAGFDTGASTSQVVPLLVGGNEAVVGLSRHLLERGIKAPAIRSPAVPAGTERVRLSLHAAFDAAQEDRVVAALGEWKRGS